MRILIVSNTYPPGDISGVGTLAFELARQLEASGHAARVLTRRAPPEDPWAVPTGGPKLLFPLTAALVYLRLAGEGFDLVHVHESDGVLVAVVLRLARALGRPAGRARLVSTLQVSYRRERLAVRPVRAMREAGAKVVSRPTAGERLFAWLRAPLLSSLGRLTARLSDSVVAPSRATAAELEEDYGARVAAVIPNGVRPPGIERGAPAPVDDAELVILFAGRLRTRKAAAVLLEAFRGVVRRRPRALLVIAGDGEQRQRVERRVAELELGERVRLLGGVPRDELGRWYAAADVYCLPSTYEGFPLAILEAMSVGLPVVATRVAGVPEAVADGVTGRLVEAEDASALEAALEELAADPERRRRLGEAGRRAVAERFSIERVAGEYLALWRRLLGDPRAAAEGS